MSVFTRSITLFVILLGVSVFGGSEAFGGWLYRIDEPAAPRTTKKKTLHNPTVAQIQSAIRPRTRIDVIGTVDASNGDRLYVEADDVKLNFNRAGKIKWHGDDTWGGFVEVSGHRVEVRGLRMEVESWGRCRGIVINSPASDVLFSDCSFTNVADGLIADGEWERLAVEHTDFNRCSDWESTGDMEGGYGIFLEEDDDQADHVRLTDVNISLGYSSGQHGIRISKAQSILLENSKVGANNKRSLWAYGVEYVSITGTTFDKGSVLFNLKRDEWMTDRPVRHVRMWNCRIDHDSILTPLTIFCGKRTADVKIKSVDITSRSTNKAIEVAWREDGGNPSRDICWLNGSMKFNGSKISGNNRCVFSGDWSDDERREFKIGSVSKF